MNIDKAGRHDHVRSVDFFDTIAQVDAHRGDAVADNPDIAPPRRAAGAVDYQAVAYQDVEAAHSIAPHHRRLCGVIIAACPMRWH
jgi:hypothetical protein